MSIDAVNDMQYEPYSVWHTPKLETVGHGIAADFLSMCISLAAGSPICVEEARCANAEERTGECVFRFAAHGLTASAEDARSAFVQAALQEDGTSL